MVLSARCSGTVGKMQCCCYEDAVVLLIRCSGAVRKMQCCCYEDAVVLLKPSFTWLCAYMILKF